MALTPTQEQILAALQGMPEHDRSPENKIMLRKLQQIQLESGRAGLPGSVSSMIELGGNAGRALPLLPSDLDSAKRQASTPGQVCPNCQRIVAPKSMVGGRVFACPCGRKWTGPSAVRIASIDPRAPRNQPRTPPAYPSPGKPEVRVSSQKWRIKGKDKGHSDD